MGKNNFHGAKLRSVEDMFHRTQTKLQESESKVVIRTTITTEVTVASAEVKPVKKHRRTCKSRKVELIASSDPKKAWAIGVKHYTESLKVEVNLPEGHFMRGNVEYIRYSFGGHTSEIRWDVFKEKMGK